MSELSTESGGERERRRGSFEVVGKIKERGGRGGEE